MKSWKMKIGTIPCSWPQEIYDGWRQEEVEIKAVKQRQQMWPRIKHALNPILLFDEQVGHQPPATSHQPFATCDLRLLFAFA